MKLTKTLCMFAAYIVMGLASMSAQTESTAPSAEEIKKTAQTITKHMAKRYSLNEEQMEAVGQLNQSNQKMMAKIRETYKGTENRASLLAALEAQRNNYNEMLKELLSDKQYEKYTADETKRLTEEAEKNSKELSRWGPMTFGANVTNLLGWNAKESDSTAIVKRETERLVKKYKLSEEQAAQLEALNMAEVKAEIEERIEMAKGELDQETRSALAESAKKRTANYERYLKEIFTEEQYKKYTNAKKAAAAASQNMRGPGGMRRRW